MEKIRPVKIKDGFYINEKYFFSHKVYWYHFVIQDVTDRYFSNVKIDRMIYDLKHNGAFFVFDHSMDYTVQSIFHIVLKALGILKIFEENEISLDRLILITPTASEHFYQKSAIYDYVRVNEKEYDKKIYHHIFFNSLWQQAQQTIPRNPVTDYIKTLDYNKAPQAHFLTFARRDSINRRLINYFLHSNNLFSKGFVSHQRVIENDIVKSRSEHQNEVRMLASRNDFNVKDYLNFGYKKHFLEDTQDKGFSAIDYASYKKHSSISCFDLVSETDVQNNLFVTEKVLKPIIHRKPFMVSGSAKTLCFLKNLGFQTFESLFDESYDNELVFYDRVCMIFENIKYFCSLSLDDCYEKMQSIDEVLIHNQKHFIETDWSFNVDKNIQKRINKVLNV